jgi:hypothetical protein
MMRYGLRGGTLPGSSLPSREIASASSRRAAAAAYRRSGLPIGAQRVFSLLATSSRHRRCVAISRYTDQRNSSVVSVLGRAVRREADDGRPVTGAGVDATDLDGDISRPPPA